jgi:hypothetical protein
MVQVIENATDLDAIVIGRAEHPEWPGFDLLTVHVKSASPVAGVADLLSSRVGARVDVAIKRDLLPAGDLAGSPLKVRASMAGPGVVRAQQLLTRSP